MSVRQTQTKLFHWGDQGLDFSAGSINRFPEVFKKMLVTGYNPQVVSSVGIAGNTVTLTYAEPHGYQPDRVLEFDSPSLDAQYYIDSVTSTTVTFEKSTETTGVIAGGFNSKVAGIGLQLVFESERVHLYKMKTLKEEDFYLRLCFQRVGDPMYYRNCVAVATGLEADPVTGFITDDFSDVSSRTCQTASENTSGLWWDFTRVDTNPYRDYTFAQGVNQFGQCHLVGSPYHIAVSHRIASGAYEHTYGVFPVSVINSPVFALPVLLIASSTPAPSSSVQGWMQYVKFKVGAIGCALSSYMSLTALELRAKTNYLPENILSGNVSVAKPLELFTEAEGQYIGCVSAGLYNLIVTYVDYQTIAPVLLSDAESSDLVLVTVGRGNNVNRHVYFAFPVEEASIAYQDI